jgi:uncharacterized HAD superfamily protein
MKIGFDLDGCVIQLMPTILSILKQKYGLSYTERDVTSFKLEDCLGITEKVIIDVVDLAIMKWERNKPYEGAIDFINEYHRRSKQKVTFVTARRPKFRIATFNWLDRWLPHTPYELILTGDYNKGEITSNVGLNVFVEDNIDGVFDLAQNGIFVFMPARPWNKDVGLPNVITFHEWADIHPILDYYGGNNGKETLFQTGL